MDVEFNKLVDSLTKQQQRRSDLDVAIKKADARKKTVEADLAAMQRKEEMMMRQIPETKRDISCQNAFYVSQQADLRQLQNGCAKLQGSLEAARRKVEQRQEYHHQENKNDAATAADITSQLNKNLVSMERALDLVKNK